MRWLLVLAFAGCHQPPRSFNDRVLALVSEYPARSFGGYAWPAAPGTAGTTRDLVLGDSVIARGGIGNHCVGMTLEVFWRALEACPSTGLDVASAADFKRRWYVPALGGAGPADALPAHELGARISVDDARPGDFMQVWTHDESLGHSMIFLGSTVDSTNSACRTSGIDVSESVIGDRGFDPAKRYLARAACP